MYERRGERLDGLFEIGLILLSILSAAEFEYALVTENPTLHAYALRVFTVPVIVLILFWLIKELSEGVLRNDLRMLLSEFCWDFWSFTLFFYLLLIFGQGIGISLSFILSLGMIALVTLAYNRASPIEDGDRSMRDYFKSRRWSAARWIVVFGGSYVLLLLIVRL